MPVCAKQQQQKKYIFMLYDDIMHSQKSRPSWDFILTVYPILVEKMVYQVRR
jgi:hypothetical protein